MSKQQFTRSFHSLAEFRDQFGEAYVEAQSDDDAAVSRLRREQREHKVETGVTFVPAEKEGLTRSQRRAQQAAIDAVVTRQQNVAREAMKRVHGR